MQMLGGRKDEAAQQGGFAPQQQSAPAQQGGFHHKIKTKSRAVILEAI